MADKRCPFCNELNEADHKFCVYCGKEFPLDGDEQSIEDKECLNCPACNEENHQENIECKKCGYLLKEDIKNAFLTSNEREYKRCPKCGNIMLSNSYMCSICGYDFSDLKIQHDSSDEFFKNHPECMEYGKNLDFFKDINKFNDYNTFLFEFKESCSEKNIDLPFYDVGMIKCPECSHFFSFISPHFIINHDCPHCGMEFDFEPSEEVYCLNCGRPVSDGQARCECGYEFADMECPVCKTYNSYTNSYCTSCGRALRGSDFRFPDIKPRGCDYEDNKIILDFDSLKQESLKNPYSINDRIYTDVLRSEYLKHEQITGEICSRWWIVSPTNCKSCQSKIKPLMNNCPKCDIYHYGAQDNRVKELKTVRNNYSETRRGMDELSNLKWNYKFSDEDLNDYLNSLAPKIGESQLEYQQRLFKEWAEDSFIKYLIKAEWNIYFENSCMNCGGEFEKYNVFCPSCGMKKDVSALSVLLGDNHVVREAFPHQLDDFSNKVIDICQSNGGDARYADSGIVSCPECSNYFHYLTHDFIATQRCPHCGVHFDFNAVIYHDEWDYEGLSYEEYIDQFYDIDL